MKYFKVISWLLFTFVASIDLSLSARHSRIRQTDPVYELARFEGDHIRAVGTARSYLEDVAMEEAENAAAAALAKRIETAIVVVQDRHSENAVRHGKVVRTAQEMESRVRTFVSQSVSYVVIGTPSVYRKRDKTIEVYVCVQLATDISRLLGEAYNEVVAAEAAEWDKADFVHTILSELKKNHVQ